MSRDVSLQKLVLFKQIVNWGQIFPIILRGKKSLNLGAEEEGQNCGNYSSQKLYQELS